MEIVRQVMIRAKQELVWDVITDLRNAKKWAAGFEDYPHISKDWPRESSEAVWRYHAGFMTMDFKLKMKTSIRGQLLQIQNSSAFGRGLETYRFRLENGFTIVDYETTTEPNWFGRILMPLMKRKLLLQVDTTIANLKQYCERLDTKD